jgi:hypothetical protein
MPQSSRKEHPMSLDTFTAPAYATGSKFHEFVVLADADITPGTVRGQRNVHLRFNYPSGVIKAGETYTADFDGELGFAVEKGLKQILGVSSSTYLGARNLVLIRSTTTGELLGFIGSGGGTVIDISYLIGA